MIKGTSPEQKVEVSEGRCVYQSRLSFGESKREYLDRVFVYIVHEQKEIDFVRFNPDFVVCLQRNLADCEFVGERIFWREGNISEESLFGGNPIPKAKFYKAITNYR